TNHHHSVIRARNRPSHEEQILVSVNLHDLDAANGDAFITHASGHSLALGQPAAVPAVRAQTTDRARRAVLSFRTVRSANSLEVVPLHHAREALALALANDIHEHLTFDVLERQGLAELEVAGVLGIDLKLAME